MKIITYKAIQYDEIPVELQTEIVEFFTNDFNNDVEHFSKFTIDINSLNLLDFSKFLIQNGFENGETVLIEGIY